MATRHKLPVHVVGIDRKASGMLTQHEIFFCHCSLMGV